MNKTVKTAVTMVIALAVTMFLFRHDKPDLSTWIGVGSMMAIIYIAMFVPAIGDFMVAKPKAVFWSGVAIAAGGLIIPLVWVVGSDHVAADGEPDPMVWVTVYAMMVGICLTILPRSIAATRRNQQALEGPKSDPTHGDDRGDDEGWAANLETLRQIGPFLRLAGPWILLVWALPLLGLHLGAYVGGITASIFTTPQEALPLPEQLFWVQTPFNLALALGVPMALVAWHRYLLESRFAVASSRGKAVLGYLWRLWILMAIFSVTLKVALQNGPDAARLLGMSDAGLAAKIIFWALVCFAAFRGSQFALVFPAVAIGKRDFAGMDSLRLTRPLGTAFRLGFLVSLLPLACLWWLLDWIETAALPFATAQLFHLAPVAVMFLALASGATYLSNVYADQMAVLSASGKIFEKS